MVQAALKKEKEKTINNNYEKGCGNAINKKKCAKKLCFTNFDNLPFEFSSMDDKDTGMCCCFY